MLLGRVARWTAEEAFCGISVSSGVATSKTAASAATTASQVVSSAIILAIGAADAASKTSTTVLSTPSATETAAAHLGEAGVVRLYMGDEGNEGIDIRG